MNNLKRIAEYLADNGFTSNDSTALLELYDEDLTRNEIFYILGLLAAKETTKESK